ncbi:MAG: Gfo/Idh/MocA family oxidoreductase [Syntrophales bacterium]|nr:Gfo/Idh/MocA family oxidoreductase [Syntrophales bacterium]
MTAITQLKTPDVAVIGAGNWGKNLVRNYAGLNALKLICDKNADILGQFGRQYPHVDTCLTLSDVLARPDIQGIVIATPAETHFRIAREAMLSGKHVFVEKPFVLHEKDATELIRLAADQHLILMVGHLIQYHPSFVKLKQLVATGELGRINYIYSHRLNLGKIRREENILWSFAPHDISMILALAGEAPESVMATGGNYLHKKIADVTTTHMEFASGLKAHIFVSWLHPFKEQKLVVVGDRKMAVFDDSQAWSDKLLLYPHEIHWENNIPTPARREPERIETPQEEPLNAECRHFLHCIQTGQNPVTDGQEGLRVQQVLHAAQQSLEKNSKAVSLKRPAAGLPDSIDQPPYFVHETAWTDDGVRIGNGARIWHFSHILRGCAIGEDCNIGQNVVIGPDVTIGKGCKIQNNVSIYKGVTLEDGVFCGPSVVFTNVFNPRAHIRRMSEARPTLVKKGATLGANCTIICGNTIGSYAFVGAGAVVTHNVPDYALMTGNPARQVGWVCRCGNKLDKNFHCAACELTIRDLSMTQHL